MASLHYFLTAEEVTGPDNNPTIVGVFNKINADSLPLKRPKIVIAFGFVPDTDDIKNDKLKINFELIDPDDAVISKIEGIAKRTVPAPKKGEPEGEIASHVELDDTIFKQEGTYTIKLLCAGKLLATNLITIEKIKKKARKK